MKESTRRLKRLKGQVPLGEEGSLEIPSHLKRTQICITKALSTLCLIFIKTLQTIGIETQEISNNLPKATELETKGAREFT